MAKLLSGTRIYGNATVDTNLVISGTTLSTSTTTGALTVAGGAGIAGNLNAGNVLATNFTWANGVSILGDLYSNLGAVSGSLATLTSNAAVQAGDIATLYANAGAQAGSIATLTSNAAFQAGQIASTEGNIATANTAMKGYVDGQITSVTNAWQANAGAQAGDIATLYSNAAVQAGNIATIFSNLGSVSGSLATLTSNAAVQAGDIANIYSNLGSVSGSLSTLTSNAASQAGDIATLYANAGAQAGSIATLTSNAAVQAGIIAGLTSYANANVASYLPTYSGNIGGTLSTASQPYVTSVGTLTGLTVSGNGIVSAVLTVGQATGVNTTAYTNTIGWFTTSANSWSQLSTKNTSTGIGASTDIIAYAPNGDNNSGWIDIGITGQNFVNQSGQYAITGPNDGYVFMSAPAGANTGGNLYISTDSTGTHNDIVFSTGGFNTGQEQARFIAGVGLKLIQGTPSTSTTTGALIVAGGVGIGGNLNVQGDISLQGNIYLTGNAITFNTNNLSVTDSMIYLGSGNSGDILDIGIVGHFTSTRYQHTGLVRDASDGVWKLFANVSTEPSEQALDFTNATYSNLKIGNLDSIGVTATGNITGAYLGGTLATASQPLITSLGTLTSLTVSGNVSAAYYNYANGVSILSLVDSALSTLTSNAASQAGDIATIYANLGAVSGSLATLTANAGAQSGSIATLTSNAAYQAGQIASTESNIATANSAMKGYVDGQITSVTSAWQSNAAVQAGDIATLYANAGSQSGSIATLTSNAAYQAGQIASTEGNITTANTAMKGYVDQSNTAMKGYVDGQITSVTNAWQANAGSQAGDIATLYANAGAQAGSIATLTSNAASQAGDIATLYANAGAQAGSIATLTSNAAAQAGDIATLYANAGAQAGSIATLTSNAASQAGDIATLYSNAAVQAGIIANLTGYANTNVAAYLPTYTGTFGNLSSITSSGTIQTVGKVWANATTQSTSTTTGALNVAGGVGIAANTYIGGNVVISETRNAIPYVMGSGALHVAGGMSIAKDLWMGGNLYVANIISENTTILTVQDPLLYLQGNVVYPYNYDIGFFSDFTGGPANTKAYTGLVRNDTTSKWYLFSNVAQPSNGTVNVTDTNIIFDDLVFGNANIYGGTSSTSTTTGALTVRGGVGVTGNIKANAVYTDNYFYANGVAFTGSGGGGGSGTPGGAANTIQFNSAGSFGGATTLQYFASNGSVVSNGNVYFGAGVGDASGSFGTAGQMLTSTGTGIDWADYIDPVAMSLVFAGGGGGDDSAWTDIGSAIYTTGNVLVGATSATAYSNLTVFHTTQSTDYTNGALVVAGGAGFAGNMHVKSGYQLHIGSDILATSFPNTPLQLNTNVNSYQQVVIQNINAGANASSDFIATANNGDDSTYFVDMGIASNNYAYTGYESIKPNDAYLLNNGGNLVVGTVSAGKSTVFITGTAGTAGIRGYFKDAGLSINVTTASTTTTSGALVVNGGIGVAGTVTVGGNVDVTSGITVAGDFALNGGDLTTTSSLFNLANATATAVNEFGAATQWTVGAATGTANIRNANIYFPNATTIFSGQTSLTFANTVTTTLNIGGAATAITLGATNSTTNMLGAANVKATTASTSTTTGALVVNGGVGVVGNINVGTNVYMSATSFITTATGTNANLQLNADGTGDVSIAAGTQLFVLDTTSSTSTATGALKVAGAVAISGNLNIGTGTAVGGWHTVAGNVSPTASNVYSLGSATAWWQTTYTQATNALYADLAEHYVADEDYPPATVVIFGGDKEITISNTSHDSRVAGVISTNPAHLMNAGTPGLPLALTGRVPCLVQGPITKGDLVVTSDVPGVAQRMDREKYTPGCVIGKCLENIDDNQIRAIEVVVGRV